MRLHLSQTSGIHAAGQNKRNIRKTESHVCHVGVDRTLDRSPGEWQLGHTSTV